MTTATASTTTEIHPSWFEHPLAVGAIERSEGDPLQVLCNLHEALKWLDKNHRGKSYGQVLRERMDHAVDDTDRFCQRLEAEGYSASAISAIIDYKAPELARTRGMTLEARQAFRRRIAHLRVELGWPRQIVANHMGCSVAQVDYHLSAGGYGEPMTGEQVEMAKVAVKHGHRAAVKQFGVSPGTVARAAQRYQAQVEAGVLEVSD